MRAHTHSPTPPGGLALADLVLGESSSGMLWSDIPVPTCEEVSVALAQNLTN